MNPTINFVSYMDQEYIDLINGMQTRSREILIGVSLVFRTNA